MICEASLRAFEALISPSAAITFARASLLLNQHCQHKVRFPGGRGLLN